MKNTILALITFLIISIQANSQKLGYEIKVKLISSTDSVLYLWNYFGNTYVSRDTAYLSKKNTFVFSDSKPLEGGIYLVVNKERNKFFELLIEKEQFFEVTTSLDNPLTSTIISGSKEGNDFYIYQRTLSKIQEGRQALEEEYALIKDSLPTRKLEIDTLIKKMNDEFVEYKLKEARDKKGSFLSDFILAQKEPEIPKVLPLNSAGKPDSSYIYTYYKEHYFDDFNFSDARILRTPVYAAKLKKYFTQVLVQAPDTLIKEADLLISKSKADKETYKFCIWYFTYEAQTSNIMGIDAVFVHLVKEYYLKGEAYWVTDGILENLKKSSEKLDRLLLGKVAPNMIMWDTNSRLVALHDINANYTIVLFWDPDCGHCKAEIPKIKKFYEDNKLKYGLEVYTVCSDTNLVVWRKYLVDAQMHFVNVNGTRSATEDYHELYDVISTPVIYLLDKEKKIIAKKLSYEQVVEFIERDSILRKKLN